MYTALQNRMWKGRGFIMKNLEKKDIINGEVDLELLERKLILITCEECGQIFEKEFILVPSQYKDDFAKHEVFFHNETGENYLIQDETNICHPCTIPEEFFSNNYENRDDSINLFQNRNTWEQDNNFQVLSIKDIESNEQEDAYDF